MRVFSAGEKTISGLMPGIYQLTEVQAPAGYIIMAGTVEFTINVDGTVTYSGTAANANLVVFQNKDATHNVASFTVSNVAGTRLPATGGSGTTLYYVGGISLILLAILGFILRRKAREVIR